MQQYISVPAILLVFSSSPSPLDLRPVEKIRLMRLGINMLHHPPQPSITVCVSVLTDRRHVVCEVVRREQEGVCTNMKYSYITHKHTQYSYVHA